MKIRVTIRRDLVEACQVLFPDDPSAAVEGVLTMKVGVVGKRIESSRNQYTSPVEADSPDIKRIGHVPSYGAKMAQRIMTTNSTKTSAIADMQESIDGLRCPKSQKAELYDIVKAIIDKTM